MSFELGQWKAQCDRCGSWYKSKHLYREWTGLRVCRGAGTNDCWESRNQQEKVRGKVDRQAPPWSRPENSSEGNDTEPEDL